MPNHFHLLIEVKSHTEIAELLKQRSEADPETFPKFRTLEKFQSAPEHFISKQFSNFLSSYTQAFNKQEKRMGSLFMKNFKRKPITDELYLKKLVHYIHHNPVAGGLCRKPEDWRHSSYRSIISADTTFLRSSEAFDWSGSKEDFVAFHKLSPQLTEIEW